MKFNAIDVETASADMSSICQIGVARFERGRLVDEWESLVDPEDDFDEMNIEIHGITPEMVKGSPSLPQLATKLRELLEGEVSVCHTHFDRVSLYQAFTKYRLDPLETFWLDSARVARRTWPDVAWGGYGLKNVCDRIGYTFEHHHALEDAKAAAQILLAAMRETNRTVADWQIRVRQPIQGDTDYRNSLRRHGNPEGDLCGEVICFTGALQIHRREAADLAASVGCEVEPGVTKHTTILVVGDQDVHKLNGHQTSTKHRKAEQLAADGQHIRIIRETDFKVLVGFAA